jgi:hypothetical protein
MGQIRLPNNDERVMVSRPMVGLFAMQVCAVDDATDEEILSVCNSQNPAGTSNGWMMVVRKEGDVTPDANGNTGLPVPCTEIKGRRHFLVVC